MVQYSRAAAGTQAAWGLCNLAAAYGLLVVVGDLELRHTAHVAISAMAFALASLGIARSASKLLQT